MKRVSLPTTICFLLSVGAFVAAHADSTFVITSGKNDYWKTQALTEGTGGTTVTVNDATKYQTWLGLAGCFNEAGWDALMQLSEADRTKAIKLLFDKKNGIGFAYGRIPIGASDYGLDRYTCNESKDDFAMANFSVERDKKCLMLYIKAAQAVKPNLQFWASAWTPPTWMKTGAADAAGYDGGVMKNEPKYLAANALYTAKWCEAYKAEGIPIGFVVPQNEPGYAQHYPSCGWGRTRSQDGSTTTTGPEFLSTYTSTYLGDTLKKRCPDTKIWYGCLSNDVTAPDYWNGMKAKANCKEIIKGFAGQWNCVTFVKGAISDGYLTMCSEHKCGNYPWIGKTASSAETADSTSFLESMAPNNHAYGVESWGMLKSWIKEGVNIYSGWNMILDTKGLNLDKSRVWPQNAMLVVDRQAKVLKETPYYYVMRHVGQYVDSGAVRIGTSGGDALAFKNPNGSIVVTAYNPGSSAAQTTIAVGGKNYKVSIPSTGWATLVANWIPPVETVAKKWAPSNRNELKVIAKESGYSVILPSAKAGRIDLMTLSGRVVESRSIPQGSSEITLKRSAHDGLLLVKISYENETKTARLVSTR